MDRWEIRRSPPSNVPPKSKPLWLRSTFSFLVLTKDTNTSFCAVEKDDNTFITGSGNSTLKAWNTTTCECLDTLQTSSPVCCLLKTKDNSRFVCGLLGSVELRRVSDLGVLSLSFNIHVWSTLWVGRWFICECSMVTMKRWDEKGRVLQTFSGHSRLYPQSDRVEQRRHRECITRQNSEDVESVNRRMSSHFDSSFWQCVWTGKGEGWCVCKWVLWGQEDSGVGWERRLHWDSPKQEGDYSDDETERWIDCHCWYKSGLKSDNCK